MPRLDYVRKEYLSTDIAYLAGIIDGEGCIYIGNFSNNPKTGEPYHQTNMQVTSTDQPLIDWLVVTFGGLFSKRTAKQHSINSRKQAYMWTASGERLTHLCELILPFLKIKTRQCEIMLKMRKTYDIPHFQKGHSGALTLDPQIRALRQSYMDEIRSLHIRTFSHKNN